MISPNCKIVLSRLLANINKCVKACRMYNFLGFPSRSYWKRERERERERERARNSEVIKAVATHRLFPLSVATD